MPAFTAVDLSRLPPPQAVQQIDFESIYSSMVADLQALGISFDAFVESDPLVALLQLSAYREMRLRAEQNDSAQAVMPAHAVRGDLDNIAARYFVQRLVITPADPQTDAAAVMESDDDLRRRMMLAFEGFSTAGPEGAYVFHALSADAGVLDASASSPTPDDIRQIVMDVLTANDALPGLILEMQDALDAADWPGDVRVAVLARAGDGTPPQDILDAVTNKLRNDDVRPLTDNPIVEAAEILPYAVALTIYTLAGPGAQVVIDTAETRVAAHVSAMRRLGRDVTRSGLIAAAHIEGVHSVVVTSPAADVICDRNQAAHCTGIAIIHGGVNE